MGTYQCYEPLDVLKTVCPGVWIVDGAAIDYRLGPATLPCPTRMTVLDCGAGQLLLHSPTAWSDELAAALRDLGDVRHLVAPNSFHHTHIMAWSKAFPKARVYAAPRMPASAILPTGTATLSNEMRTACPGGIQHIVVDAKHWAEVAFFHGPSRTLVLTDLIQNFEKDRVKGRIETILLRLGGCMGTPPKPSLDMRMTAAGGQWARDMREAFAQIRAWEPERVLIAHGAPLEGPVGDLLRAAFDWA